VQSSAEPEPATGRWLQHRQLRLDHHDQHRHNFRGSYLQNMERQFLSAFLRLGWLTVDKDPEIAFLIFYEEIEILLVDLSLF
jgi:hypothetical protein